MKLIHLFLSVSFLMLIGCVNTRMGGGKTEGVLKASWYGEKFHGRQTASGEIYNMYDRTAAHRSLPFGTKLRVKNLANQRVTTVKVNDRGPFIRGRDLDLSYGAAKDLDMMSQGVAEVFVENLGRAGGYEKTVRVAEPVARATPVAAESMALTIQVASFRDRANAEHLKEGLALNYSPVFIEEASGQSVFRVKVGHFSSREEAEQVAQQLAEEGYTPWIVKEAVSY